MSKLKMCRICLRTDRKMYHMRFTTIQSYRPKKKPKFDPVKEYAKLPHIKYYSDVMGLSLSEKEVPALFFCQECVIIIHEFQKFREKCYMVQNKIKMILYSEDQQSNAENDMEGEINPIDHLLL